MHKVFDHPLQGREAGGWLLSLRQGQNSVSHFAIDFCILATKSGCGHRALQSVFLKGLSEELKDELAARDDTPSLLASFVPPPPQSVPVSFLMRTKTRHYTPVLITVD